jgi:hypothetical protein
MNKLAFLIFFALLIFNFQTFAQSQDVDLIKIRSSWSGLGPAKTSILTIKQKKGKFYADGKEIEARLIDELLKQIGSEEKRTLESLGITQEWLDANAEKTLPDWLKKSLPNEKELFLKSFRDIKLVEKILPRLFESWTDEKGIYHMKYWTDDYPEVKVEMQKTDGSTIRIASSRQILFMFDNPKLGRAIAALLPKKFANRERLNGDYLSQEIAKEILDEIEDDLNLLKTKNRIGNELEQLKDQYTIRKTDINYLTSIDVGRLKNEKDWQKNPGFPSWNATLNRNDLPPNLIIGVSLPYKENRLVTFPVFLEKIDGIIRHVMSVPWLSRYIAENPETEFEIRFVEDRSFSTKGKENFLEDLKTFGADSLNAEIIELLDKSVFIVVLEKRSNWSRWLILPDGRMILWQTKGDSTLKWKPADFETRNMYDTKDWFQTKAVISPDGEIISR